MSLELQKSLTTTIRRLTGTEGEVDWTKQCVDRACDDCVRAREPLVLLSCAMPNDSDVVLRVTESNLAYEYGRVAAVLDGCAVGNSPEEPLPEQLLALGREYWKHIRTAQCEICQEAVVSKERHRVGRYIRALEDAHALAAPELAKESGLPLEEIMVLRDAPDSSKASWTDMRDLMRAARGMTDKDHAR